MTTCAQNKVAQAATASRAGAIAGILFAMLLGGSIVLMRLSVLPAAK